MNTTTTPTRSREIVAGEIRAAMGRIDMSQAELAQKIPMSRAALSERLAGQRPFTTDHIYAIATALGVDPLSLMCAPRADASRQPTDLIR